MKTRLLALALMLGVVAAAPSASAAESADTRTGRIPDQLETVSRPTRGPVRHPAGPAGLGPATRREDHVGARPPPGHRPGTPHRRAVRQPRRARRRRRRDRHLRRPDLLPRAGVTLRHRRRGPPGHRRQHPGVLPHPGSTARLHPVPAHRGTVRRRWSGRTGSSAGAAWSGPAGCSAMSTPSASPATTRRCGSDSASGRSTGWACPTAPRSAPTTRSSSRGGSGRWCSTRALDHSASSLGLLADEIATVEDAFNRFAEWCRTHVDLCDGRPGRGPGLRRDGRPRRRLPDTGAGRGPSGHRRGHPPHHPGVPGVQGSHRVRPVRLGQAGRRDPRHAGR